MDRKRCTKCGKFKETSDFPISNQHKDGFYSWCKECKKDSQSDRDYKRNIENLKKPKVCRGCLKLEPEVEFSYRNSKLCKICKIISHEKEILSRRIKSKTCNICGMSLNINKFISPTIRTCIDCSSKSCEEKKILMEKWKEKRKRDRKARIDFKISLIEKLGGKCADCELKPSDIWPSSCFDFHHLENKDSEISKMVHSKRSRKLDLENELKKCVILCANCHRRRHHEEKEKENGT